MRLWPVLILALSPGLGLAETVAVRSGEHVGFSRLVVYYGPGADWSLAPVEGGYELRPAATDTTYDLRPVYERIPRDRIAEVTAGPEGALVLSVSCDCHAKAFGHLGKAVIDVVDGPDPEAPAADLPQTESPASDTAPPDAATPASDAASTASGATPLGSLPPYTPQGARLAWPGLAVPAPSQPPLSSPVAMDTLDVPDPDPRLAATRSALVRQIARAAAEGLVTAAPELPQDPESAAALPVPDRAEGAADKTPPASEIAGANVRVETAFERGELPQDPPAPQTDAGAACLPDHHFDLASWGSPPDEGAALAEYRAGLIGEFDAADPESLAALARHYIYLTFGAEALGLIRTFDAAIEDAALLTMLAEIMDDGRSDAFPAIADQLSCDAAGALWAVLARPNLTRADRVSRPAILSAFAALPLHLRRHLGPGLAQRFLQIGDAKTAATIRNSVLRAPGPHGPEVRMMEAEIALQLGDHEDGVAQLAEVLSDGGSKTPEAVLALIEARLGAGEAADDALLETAMALAYEARGSEIGARLILARLRALAHRAEVVRALDELDAATGGYDLTAEAVAGFRREVLGLAAGSASDADFLQVVFRSPPDAAAGKAAEAIRRQVAARLIDLTLYPEARQQLGQAQGKPSTEDRLLYARSYLGEGRPELAIGYLAGLGDETALELRAEAHAQAREYGRAAALYAELGQPAARARAAWRGQDLETVRDAGSDAERAAAALAADSETVDPAGDEAAVSLAGSEAILRRSRESRDILAALLAEIAGP